MKSAIIIGGGPAGCQCALWLHLSGHAVLLVEEKNKLGGLQAESPYPNEWIPGVMQETGLTFAKRMQEHLQQLQVPTLLNTHVEKIIFNEKKFVVTMNNSQFETQTVVIATGVKPKHDDLFESEKVIIGPGERVFNFNFAGKRVAILGGGDNACENYAAIQLQKPNVCHVYARHLRARKNLKALVNSNDIFLSSYHVNQNTMTISRQNSSRDYDVIVVMYGWEANFPDVLLSFQSQLLDHNHFIATNAYCETPVKGIYAIGEIANRSHPCVITAMADGVVAAKRIQEMIEK